MPAAIWCAAPDAYGMLVCCDGAPLQELMKKFKRMLRTEVAKDAFKELLRRFVRIDAGRLYIK